MKYSEFNDDESNLDLAWGFLNNSLPKLFIDYSEVNIHIGDYKWDKYKNQLDTLNFTKEFVFSIGAASELNTIKEIYYYISNSKEVLTKNELDGITDWVEYEDIVEINEEGSYTIYAKVISSNGRVTYLNTDLIMFDLSGANIIISTSLGDKSWNTLMEDVDVYYIDDSISININTDDELSGVKEVYYYTTDKVLTLEELNSLEKWNKYEDSILISDKKTVLYAKVIDNCGNVVYVNSDLIIMNGYVLNSIYPGISGKAVENLHITQDSSVSLNFSYLDVIEYRDGDKHQLISNVLLPENTNITLIDKINNKVYKYVNIMEYRNDEYVITNKISDTNLREMRRNMEESDVEAFDEFIERCWGTEKVAVTANSYVQNEVPAIEAAPRRRGRPRKNIE